MELSRKQPTHR